MVDGFKFDEVLQEVMGGEAFDVCYGDFCYYVPGWKETSAVLCFLELFFWLVLGRLGWKRLKRRAQNHLKRGKSHEKGARSAADGEIRPNFGANGEQWPPTVGTHEQVRESGRKDE
tara:strand:- start:146 stop:493 length:348 start_codon:yes stop_codon:yes gene_type:complete